MDILLNVVCHSVIDTMFKNLQNFVPRDNIIFNWTGPFPFHVIFISKKKLDLGYYSVKLRHVKGCR